MGSRLIPCLLASGLLSGCCLSDAHAQRQWRFTNFWKADFVAPAVTPALFEVRDRDPEAEDEGPDRSQKQLEQAYFRQLPATRHRLEQAMRTRLLSLGWVLQRDPDPQKTLGWRLEYSFITFNPSFRGFSPAGFFRNLVNPLPGAALVGAFPRAGGDYRIEVIVYDCLDGEAGRVEVSASGPEAPAELATRLAAELRGLALRAPPPCRPANTHFGGS